MKRKIIKINEELCNGCGNCVVGCSEGALKIVDGKAKLIREDFCDGFGDCVGVCPTGAMVIEERRAVAFDLEATKEHLLETEGIAAVNKMLAAQKKHEVQRAPVAAPSGGGCQGRFAQSFNAERALAPVTSDDSVQVFPGELRQWPIQLHLVSPRAPFFAGKELVVMSTCGPLASPDVHWRYLRGRSVVVACPKLDDTAPYAAKLAGILAENDIPRVHVVIMEVPCCGGLTAIVREAAALSGRQDLEVIIHTLTLQGAVKR